MRTILASRRPAFVFALRCQHREPPRPNPGVQVGVPEGRVARQPRRRTRRGRQAGRLARRHARPPAGSPRRRDAEEKGVWLPGPVIPNPLAVNAFPYQPWAKALVASRETNELDPHTRCKPSGIARQFLTPYGVEFVELTELQRIYIFDIGGPHSWRTVYMDGRSHPRPAGRPTTALDGCWMATRSSRPVAQRVVLVDREVRRTRALHTIERSLLPTPPRSAMS